MIKCNRCKSIMSYNYNDELLHSLFVRCHNCDVCHFVSSVRSEQLKDLALQLAMGVDTPCCKECGFLFGYLMNHDQSKLTGVVCDCKGEQFFKVMRPKWFFKLIQALWKLNTNL